MDLRAGLHQVLTRFLLARNRARHFHTVILCTGESFGRLLQASLKFSDQPGHLRSGRASGRISGMTLATHGVAPGKHLIAGSQDGMVAAKDQLEAVPCTLRNDIWPEAPIIPVIGHASHSFRFPAVALTA
ncbi:MAG TPA: hypothetical protein VMH80_03330 [Bryobacteraceae bacterium]|nr:hypothetical protein [Bryobacteraceae bacterium]